MITTMHSFTLFAGALIQRHIKNKTPSPQTTEPLTTLVLQSTGSRSMHPVNEDHFRPCSAQLIVRHSPQTQVHVGLLFILCFKAKPSYKT